VEILKMRCWTLRSYRLPVERVDNSECREGHFPYFYSPHFFEKDGKASAKWFRAASRSAEALSM
jgi:hypothetical protein